MAAPLFAYHTLAIIVHNDGRHILLSSEAAGWSLPSTIWEKTTYEHWTDVTTPNCEMSRQIGERLMALRCLSNTYNGELNCFTRIYLMELQSSTPLLSSALQWINISKLSNGLVLLPEHQSTIEQWLTAWNTYTVKTPPVPWYKTGWFAEITDWIERQVVHSGEKVVGAPEQLRVGERGCLLRITTTEGTWYLKALPSFFAHELSLLKYLAFHYPSTVPSLVATNAGSHAMLMRDFAGTLLSQSKNLSDVEEALRRYATLQIELVDHVQSLRTTGCPDLPTEKLASRLEILLMDSPDLLMNIPGGLSEEDMLHLHTLVPRLHALCQQLASYPIPPTLEHGDFHNENIAIIGEHPLYFDWTDSCIAHPFFSLYPFLLVNETSWAHIAPTREHIRDAYLQPWECYTSKEQLLTIFELAQTLAPLHLAMLYASLIIPNMEAKWEMQHGVTYNLRILLERMNGEIQ